MSEFNEQDNIIEEETPVLHLELEDGTEQDCAVIALFSVEELNDQEYIALVSIEDLESEDEESALLLYRYNEDSEEKLCSGTTPIRTQNRLFHPCALRFL